MPSARIATVDSKAGVPPQLGSAGPYARKLTLPLVGLCSPPSVASSVIVAPTTTAGEALDAIVADRLATVTDSPGSLHAAAAASLFASPLYVATQRYVPGAVGVCGADVAVPSAAIVDVVCDSGVAEQVASSGP